jgi:hypothetical protein
MTPHVYKGCRNGQYRVTRGRQTWQGMDVPVETEEGLKGLERE